MVNVEELTERLTRIENVGLVAWLLVATAAAAAVYGIPAAALALAVLLVTFGVEEWRRFEALAGRRPPFALAVPVIVETATWALAFQALRAIGPTPAGFLAAFGILAAGLWPEHDLVDALTRGLALGQARLFRPRSFAHTAVEAAGGAVLIAFWLLGGIWAAAGILVAFSASREEHRRGVRLTMSGG